MPAAVAATPTPEHEIVEQASLEFAVPKPVPKNLVQLLANVLQPGVVGVRVVMIDVYDGVC